MTNGEKLKEIFPSVQITECKSYIQVMGENYEFNNTYPLVWWNTEYKESNKSENPNSSIKNDLEVDKAEQKTDYTWEDVSSVMDAMEYKTNSLIENIKSEILHFANAHCSGDDINIYDVFKVIDDCCEVEE